MSSMPASMAASNTGITWLPDSVKMRLTLAAESEATSASAPRTVLAMNEFTATVYHAAMAPTQDTKSMAVFCDFENVALGVREAKYAQLDISKVLERLLLKGSIVV